MAEQKKALVLGASGFIGTHLCRRLKQDGYWVRGVDIAPEKYPVGVDEFEERDMTLRDECTHAFAVQDMFDEVYQLAANMGGAGLIFSGSHDADIMADNAKINLHSLEHMSVVNRLGKIFFASSACVYQTAEHLFLPDDRIPEEAAYPANPDSDYGFEKLFSERLYQAHERNYGIDARIGRFHNIYGPLCAFEGGREKAPAAICRKIALAYSGDTIELWGDGSQTRSFCYIDDAVEAVIRLMRHQEPPYFRGPVNIGSEESISISGLAKMVARISGKSITLKFIPGPVGVNARNSDNDLIREYLGWEPSTPLEVGMAKLYEWVDGQINTPAERARKLAGR